MAPVAGLTLIMMMMLVTYAQLTQDLEPLFGTQGGKVSFPFMSSLRYTRNFFAILYRSTAEGIIILMNTSAPSQHSDSEQVERFVYTEGRNIIQFKNLTLSDSGYYMTERWGNGVLKERRNYSLTVCKNQCNGQVEYDGRGTWSVKNVSHGITLQVYKTPREDFFEKPTRTSLVLDTMQSLKVLPGEQKSKIMVHFHNGTVDIIGTPIYHDTYSFTFLISSWGQCCISKEETQYQGALTCLYDENIFLKPGRRLTLPCSDVPSYTEEIVWKTPLKELSMDLSVSLNVSHHEEEGMYIQPSNYSLVIQAVETKHMGNYKCDIDYYVYMSHTYDVFVCSDLEATHVLFSLGEAADLVCGADLNVFSATVIFYGHLDQEQEQLSLSPEHMKVINEKRINKGTMFHDQFYLTMSDLTLNDSGLYLCRIWGYAEEGKLFCYDRKIYLLYKHPFGIDSTFSRVYSSLMACGLLGMICAVIFVHLRVRGRDRTSQSRLRRTAEPSGCPTREGEQTGGDPDHDDLITAEDV